MLTTLPREYRFEVKEFLRTTDNEIRIVIQPAVREAADRAAAYPYEVPAMVVRCTLYPHINTTVCADYLGSEYVS